MSNKKTKEDFLEKVMYELSNRVRMKICQGHKQDKNILEIKMAFMKNNCNVFLLLPLIQWKNEMMGEKRG